MPLSFTNTAQRGLDIDSSVAAHCSSLLWKEGNCYCASTSRHKWWWGLWRGRWNVPDPTFIPITHNLDIPGPCDMSLSFKRRCLRPAVEVLEEKDDDDGDDADNNDEVEFDQPAPQTRQPTKTRKQAARPSSWKKVDLNKLLSILASTSTHVSSTTSHTRLIYVPHRKMCGT